MTTINDPMVQRGPWLSVVAVTAGGLLVGVAQADVVYVDHAAAGGGDGTSWAEAFASLSAALAASAPGDEIWVTGGGYGNVSLRGGIDVYGGFTGEEVERDERDWLANETTVGSVLATNETGTVRLDGFTTDHVTMSFADLELRNCHIAPSAPHELGAGLHAEDGGTLLLSECTVTDGEAEIGGALYVRDLSVVRLLDSTFIGNRATVGIGGVGIFRAETIEIAGCSFIDNDGGSSSGGLATGNGNAVQVIRDCRFIANRAEANAGGFGTSYGGLIVNCVFSRNSAEVGGGFIAASDEPIEMVNCSFSNNAGDGLCLNLGTSVSVANSVFWGNTPASLAGHVEGLTVNFSDVQGGWPGSANIDADPLFVQPGADDLRLGLGSPCLNAGNNPSVPEGIDTDLAGAPRIQRAFVDMGAYEGEFEPLPPMAVVQDFDEDDVEFLVPDGVGYDPVSFATVVARNVSGGDDATMSVTQLAAAVHPDAAGFTEIGDVLVLETSLPDGTYFATVSIPFDAAALGGADPADVDLTAYDGLTGNWTLAATANTIDSPGHIRRFGDRTVVIGDGATGFGVSSEIGDFGVFWNPSLERGFAWATVDHAGDYAIGNPLCPADTHQPPNGLIGFEDLIGVIGAWGTGGGPYDVDGDETVGASDLVDVLARWGVCDG